MAAPTNNTSTDDDNGIGDNTVSMKDVLCAVILGRTDNCDIRLDGIKVNPAGEQIGATLTIESNSDTDDKNKPDNAAEAMEPKSENTVVLVAVDPDDDDDDDTDSDENACDAAKGTTSSETAKPNGNTASPDATKPTDSTVSTTSSEAAKPNGNTKSPDAAKPNTQSPNATEPKEIVSESPTNKVENQTAKMGAIGPATTATLSADLNQSINADIKTAANNNASSKVSSEKDAKH